MRVFLPLLCCLAVSPVVMAKTAYKWTDADGYTQISQFPPTNVDSDKVTIIDIKAQSIREEAKKEPTPPTPEEKFNDDVAKRCSIAKDNLKVLESDKIVQLKDENGNLQDLSEAEKKIQLTLAKKEVDLYCK